MSWVCGICGYTPVQERGLDALFPRQRCEILHPDTGRLVGACDRCARLLAVGRVPTL